MIDYQAIAKAGGISKGDPRKRVKARKARADTKALQAFRDQVWARETGLDCDEVEEVIYQVARCQHCEATVIRGLGLVPTGEVHHRIGRRTKATRYDPANGVLLCNHLVNDCHRAAQEHRIKV